MDVTTWGKCKVIGTGKVNFQYRIMEGGATGMSGNAAYAEVRRIISSEAQIDPHPFKVGEIYTVKAWNGQCYGDKEYRVTKVTEEKVTLKSGNERAITRRPRKFRSGSSSSGYAWALGIVDGMNGTIYKNDEGNR